MSVFDRNSWDNFLKDNELCYMDSQRSVDSTHVDSILTYLNDRVSTRGDASFLTPIVIGELKDKYYIIDGQHRIGALSKFEGRYDLLVNLITLKNENDLFYHLRIVNTNKPYIQIGTNHVKKIEGYIIDNYGKYIRTSDSPRAPHININNTVKFLNKFPKLTFDMFVERFQELEKFLEKEYNTIGISHESFKKCKKDNTNPFYSGCMIDNNWLNAIVMSMETGTHIKDIDYTQYPFTRKRKKITSTDRDKLWKTQSISLEGVCYICNNPITRSTFQCGHIIPVFKGGDNHISNMKCICGICNNDCGIMNLEEYKLLVKN
jgi:hypothetical protein